MDQSVTLVWFRRDLRLADHAALSAAARGGPVLPVFIWAPEEEGEWAPGPAACWWLHHSLLRLQEELTARGLALVIRRGPSEITLKTLAHECRAERVYVARRYEPHVRDRDRKLRAALRREGIQLVDFPGLVLHEPDSVETKAGGPYRVFTPFWQRCLSRGEPDEPTGAPARLHPLESVPRGLTVAELGLLPPANEVTGLAEEWQPGTLGAARRLEALLPSVPDYPANRDRPDLVGTSRLSPHLAWGEITPRQVWAAVRQEPPNPAADAFLRQLVWREFAWHLLWHFPETTTRPLDTRFRRFPWRKDNAALEAWQRGETGCPLVDAGMRQLARTGWMHNRVRMVAGSYLVKDLLLPWLQGARWFWQRLVDADLAANTLNWQWVAGCGADAAPYFRVFNPEMQAKKFDPDGKYIGRWAPDSVGRKPLVDHGEARARALAVWQEIRGA